MDRKPESIPTRGEAGEKQSANPATEARARERERESRRRSTEEDAGDEETLAPNLSISFYAAVAAGRVVFIEKLADLMKPVL